MQIQLLGATRLVGEDEPIEISSQRQRRLLALLALRAPHVVHTDTLIAAVWPESAPGNPIAALRTVVTRLRHTLAGVEPSLGDRLVARPPGYLLDVAAEQVDVHYFELLADRAITEADEGNSEVASEAMRDAMGLWTGTALAEFADEPWAMGDAVRLEQRRVQVRAEWLDVQITSGDSERVLADIRQLVADVPLSDRPRAILMRALYASGQQAEALRAFDRYRIQLLEETGLEPGDDLRELERRILADDPLLLPADGRLLRGYRLLDDGEQSELGSRYRAVQRGLEREVVLDVIDPAHASDPGFVEAFGARCRALSRLSNARVQPIIDYWRDPDGACVVWPVFDGRSLAEPGIAASLDAEDRARVHHAMRAALEAAHRAGVPHGPVRPEHVCVDEDGAPLLVGFDLRGATSSLEDDLESLDALLARHGDPAATLTRGCHAPNPYRGLEAFQESDASLFFGRDRLVCEIIETLDESGIAVVVGASGSGKSSAVRAGVIPRLRSREERRHFVVTMTPGADPFSALEAAAMHVAVHRRGDLGLRLRTQGASLGTVLRDVVPDPDATICVVVDQLEELFTTAAEVDRDRFLELIGGRAGHFDDRLLVVATLRADHYDQPLAHPAFASICKRATVAVDHPSGDELQASIEGPAAAVGVDIERELVGRLIADVSDRPGGLPLLQYALTDLFDRRGSGPMTLSSYEELGGLAAAVGTRAEGVYRSLGNERQRQCRQVFERLVEPTASATDLRRRATVTELAGGEHNATLEVMAVVERFVSARLLSTDHDPRTRTPTVEVAHEALFREWPRLGEWIAEDRDVLRTLRHVAASAIAWQASDDNGDLLRGARLAAANELRDARPDLLTDAEQHFVLASNADEAAARVSRERQNQRLRRLLTIAGALLVALAAASGVAVTQRDDARRAEANAAAAADAAESATRTAEIARMGNAARELRTTQPDLALLLAVAAHKLAPGPETLDTLQRVLVDPGDGWLGYLQLSQPLPGMDDGFVASTYYSLTFVGSRWLVGGGDDGLHIWDREQSAVSGRVLLTPHPGNIATALATDRILAVYPVDDDHVVAVVAEGSLHFVDVTRGEVLRAIETSSAPPGPDAQGGTRRFGDGAVAASAFDPETGQTVVSTARGDALVFSGDLVGLDEIRIGLADELALRGRQVVAATGSVITSFARPDGAVMWRVDLNEVDGGGPEWRNPADVAFAADGSAIIVSIEGLGSVVLDADDGSLLDVRHDPRAGPLATQDGTVINGTSLVTGRSSRVLGPPSSPYAAALSRDGRLIALAESGRISLWSTDGRSMLATAVQTNGLVSSASADPTGRHLAWQGWPATHAETWDIEANHSAGMLEDETMIATWQPSGSLVAAASDGPVRVWPAEAVQPRVIEHSGGHSSLHTTPDGELLLVGMRAPAAGSVEIIDTATGATVATIEELVPQADPADRCSMLADVTFSPDERTLAATTYCGPAALVDTTSWTVDQVISLPDGSAINSIAWAPDGTTLALRGGDGRLHWLDIGAAQLTPGPDVGAPSQYWHNDTMAFVDDDLLAVGSRGGVQLHHRPTGAPVGAPFTNEDLVVGNVSGSGRFALTGVDGQILVWPLEADEWIQRACHAANRDLTADEWERYAPTGTARTAVCEA